MLYDNLSVNEKGNLVFSGFDTAELAAEYGTPLFVTDENRIRERCRTYVGAMKKHFGEGSMPLYAGKALCVKAIYPIMKEEGMGIDVVSSGEIFTASEGGFPMEKAFFHGNNKTDFDIGFAMDKKVGFFVCDNADELEAIDAEAKRRGTRQKIILRLTPGIDPHTHAKISTGKVDSKFGAAIETGQARALLENALSLEGVEVCGFHCHIGSQIFEIDPFVDAAAIMIDFIAEAKNELGFETKILDLGGGMGVPYTEADPKIDYEKNIGQIAEKISEKCASLSLPLPSVCMEPGRSIVADSTLTLYTVGGRKEIPEFRNYVSIDGGMPDNPRYTLYQSEYTVLTANRMNESADYECTIAGRCCESGDLIAENVKIAKPERGDLIAVLSTGAYNYSMASNYNAIPKPPIVMVKGDEAYLAVRRETFEDMTACQN